MVWDSKTIGLAIGVLFIGYFIGLFEAAIKQKNKNKNIKTEAIQEDENPKVVIQPSLLRINRGPAESLILDIGGEIFNNPENLPSEKRNTLVNLLVKLRPWVDISKYKSQPNLKQETQKLAINDKETISAKSEKNETKNENNNEEIRTGMVSEIDDILQVKIASSPLTNKGIHLIETPTGGVMVYVGLEKYDGIAAVPDPEIKRLIQSAVREWENKT
jgi:hypothetical protein